VKLIKNDQTPIKKHMTCDTFVAFDQLLTSLGVDEYGFFKIEPEHLFKGSGVPHKYALVFSSGMEKNAFETAPSIQCQRKCPTGAILFEPIIIDGFNPTGIIYDKCSEGFANYGCGICIKECPFTKGNYETIKSAHIKSTHLL